jgi:hypothetical protein
VQNLLIPLKVCWKTLVKRHILSYRPKMRVVSPSVSLDGKKDGIMAAVVETVLAKEEEVSDE